MTLFLIDKILFVLLQKKNGALREWDYVKEHDEYVLWHSFILHLPAIRLIILWYPGGISGVKESENSKKIYKVFFFLCQLFSPLIRLSLTPADCP